MTCKRLGVLAILILAGLAFSPAPASAEFDGGGSMTKLGRGAVNLATGWVEIPKRIQETSNESGGVAGWTWGLLRGLGYGFVRTAAGAYEIVTFPFPAPPGYASVIQPEFVFSEPSASSSSRFRK